jgi:hypothetical protein
MTFSNSEMLDCVRSAAGSDGYTATVRHVRPRGSVPLDCANSGYCFGGYAADAFVPSWSKTCNRTAVTLEILWLFLGGVLGVVAACAIPYLFALLRRVIELGGRAVVQRPTPTEHERE